MNSLVKWRPNPRVQPTPLAASKIVRFLKAGFGPKVVSISEAARLTRNPFGGHSYPLSSNEPPFGLSYCHD
jgi:hypothetical protein